MTCQDDGRATESEVGALDRREFLKIAGGGITIFFTVGLPAAWPQERDRSSEYPEDFNAYLRIGEDGRVSCFTGKIEMGQGVMTSLAQMLAEELGVPLEAVDMVMGDTALCPFDRGTFGSRSTKYFGPALRRAAAEARAVLVEMAAERLGTSPEGLVVRNGEVVDAENPERKITYAELARGQSIQRRVEGEAPLKPQAHYTISGRAIGRLDARAKVTGEAQYAADLRPPGLLYASILRPPVHGATLKAADTTGAEAVKGARVVRDDELIAVLHEYPDVARKARDKIRAQYELPQPTVGNDTIFEHLVRSAPAGEEVTAAGALDQGKGLAQRTFAATYYNHYVAHAPIEPHAATVEIKGDQATVWASTQTPFWVREEVARTLGLETANVRVITPFVGGGFGGKTSNQQASEAARLAKAVGKPVQVAWSRKEEFFYDHFRPAAVVKVSSGLDGTNRIVYWDYDNYFAGSRSSEPVYDVPHQRVVSRGGWRGEQPHPFAVGAWRGPGSNTNVFAMESQIDLMAAAAGLDPLDFRLRNLADQRMKKVLTAAAEKFGATFEKAPSGRGHGVACTNYLGTYVAAMAAVKVDESTGKVRVERVVCAQDMGEVINPAGARLQIEGGIIMGLGYVLTEELRFRGGEILDENFDTYELPRFSWLPEIETVLIDNPEMDPQGGGEPAITAMGAVVANAVYDAIGVRLFVLPMTPQRVRSAISAREGS